jgi:hypothetical protein
MLELSQSLAAQNDRSNRQMKRLTILNICVTAVVGLAATLLPIVAPRLWPTEAAAKVHVGSTVP